MVSLPQNGDQPQPSGQTDEGAGAPGDQAGGARRPRTTGVRYGAMGWLGEFRLPPRIEVTCGSRVVIQSERGIELGDQVMLTCPNFSHSASRDQIKNYVDECGPEFYRRGVGRVLRTATREDINEHDHLNRHLLDDLRRCREMAADLGLPIKPVTAEHLLGGERIVFYFRSEGRVDFRELVRHLARHYQTRIEMRQVGARDEARLVADYEVCGRECCCRNFLKKLRPVTMKMAKLQKSTLDPSKVSGRCGRLRCCLRYEHEGYEELVRKLPRVGATVNTESGEAVVIDRQILTQLVLVRYPDGRDLAIPNEELGRPGKPARPAVRPAPEVDRSRGEPLPETPADSTRESQESGAATESPDEAGRGQRRRRRSRRRRRTQTEGGGESGTSPASQPSADPGSSDGAGDSSAEQKTASDADASESSHEPRSGGRRRRRSRSRRRRPGPPGAGGETSGSGD